MTYLGQVLETKIVENVPIVKIKTLDGIFELAFYPNANTVSRPEPNSIVLYTQGSQSNEHIAHSGISQSISADLEAGEYVIFSTNGSVIQSSIYLKKDGQIVLNAGTDYAVNYSELNTKLRALQEQIDQLRTTLNTHVHYVSLGDVAGFTFFLALNDQVSGLNRIASFADIRVDKVRL